MAGFAETLEAVASSVSIVAQQIARDPESPGATTSVAEMAENLDRFLTSPELAALLRVDAARRRALAEHLSPAARRVSAILRETLSVALQIQELGGRVDWADRLRNETDRFAGAMSRLGVVLPRDLPAPPMVARTVGEDGRPRFGVVSERVRKPQLAPYIALALQRAQLSELEPGHWYAELEGFPGVWADGASPEECRAALEDVLHEWLIVKTAHGDRDFPVLENLDPWTLLLRR